MGKTQSKSKPSKGNGGGFLDEDYDVPSNGTSGFLKFASGDTKFRCLSNPVMGYVEWIDKKPTRYTMEEGKPETKDAKNPPKHFWLLRVWDYADNEVKILEITQASVLKEIAALAKSKEWGNPMDYDLKVTRTGEGMKGTKYKVTPSPKKALPKNIVAADKAKPSDISVMFEGGDPWQVEE